MSALSWVEIISPHWVEHHLDLYAVRPLTTLKRIGDRLTENGPMTAKQIAEALNISKGRVYESLQDRDALGITVAGKIHFVSIVGGDKRNGYIYGLADISNTIGVHESARDPDLPSTGLADVNKWQKTALKLLRAQKGNPFALLSLDAPAKRRPGV